MPLHRNTEEELRKTGAVLGAARKEAAAQGLYGVAVVVVLDDKEPLLTAAVEAMTDGGLAALVCFGAEQLEGTLGRMTLSLTGGGKAGEPTGRA